MKKISIFLLFVVSSLTLRAQSLDEGYRYINNERYGSAIHQFQQLVKADPANEQAWFALIKSYVLNKEEKKAADSLALMPAAVQGRPYGLVARGLVLLNQNKAAEAQSLLEQAAATGKGKDAGVLWAVGDAYALATKGDAAKAVDYYQRAIDRDRKNPDLYVALGNAYRQLA